MEKEWVKAYKGFNMDMTCKGFQYPESGEVHVSDEADLCSSGVHACLAPIDCLQYYPPASSVYREVWLSGISNRKSEDTKICGTDVRIGARLDIAGIVKAQIEYVKAHVKNENNAEKGKPATAGYRGAATSRGKTSVGKNGAALARGNDVLVRGGMGAILVAVEENRNDYDIKSWCAGVVDGETLQPDTWYLCQNGKFVEADDKAVTVSI